MRRAFSYRLFTNTNQERELNATLETHRRLYNACLEQRKTVYEETKRSVKYTEQSSWFKFERKTNPYFAKLNFSSAQATMRRLDRSFTNFFRRLKEGVKPGYPRFKSKDRYDSVEYPTHGDGIRLKGTKLYVQNVGTIRVKLHRPIEGTIKTVTLKRNADKWFVVFSCDLPNVTKTPSTKPPVGIDVGLTDFLTTSDNQTVDNPRYLKTQLPKLRRAARKVSRRQKGGKNRRKAVRRLQKIHSKIRNVRKEHHYKVAHWLVLDYGSIAVESLNIKGMLKNHRLARSISDVGWGAFLNILKHKAEKAGVQFVEVDPSGTTQDCSRCQNTVKKDLSVRHHDCPFCGLSLGRDLNAALNILAKAGLARTEPVGANVDQQIMRSPRSCRL